MHRLILPTELERDLHDGNLDKVIGQLAFKSMQQQQTNEDEFHLCLFQTYAGKAKHAKENFVRALERLGTKDTEYLEKWADFFHRHHCNEYAFLLYKALLDAIESENNSLKKLFGTPRKLTREQLYKTISLAIACGRADEAKIYYEQLRTQFPIISNLKCDLFALQIELASNFSTNNYIPEYHSYVRRDPLTDGLSSDEFRNLFFCRIYRLIALGRFDECKRSLNDNISNSDIDNKTKTKIVFIEALEIETNNEKREQKFLTVFHDSSADILDRTLAGAYLCQLNATYLVAYENFFDLTTKQKYYKSCHHDIRTNCVHLIASRILYNITGKLDYQAFGMELVSSSNVAPHKTLPFAIPFELRPAYFEVLLDENFWPEDTLTSADIHELALMKAQHLSFVINFNNSPCSENMRFNVALQTLAPQSLIGRIFAVGQLGGTDLTSGTKEKLFTYVCNNFHDDMYLLPSTQKAIRQLKGTPDYNRMREKFRPALMTLIEGAPGLELIESNDNKDVLNAIKSLQTHFHVHIVKSANGEFDFEATLLNLNKILNLSENREAYAIQILCLAMVGQHSKAHEQLLNLIKVDGNNIKAYAHFYFEWRCYRLALTAFIFCPDKLSEIDCVRAGMAAAKLGQTSKLKMFRDQIKSHTIHNVLYNTYLSSNYLIHKRADLRSPQGLHRKHRNPCLNTDILIKIKKNLSDYRTSLGHLILTLHKKASKYVFDTQLAGTFLRACENSRELGINLELVAGIEDAIRISHAAAFMSRRSSPTQIMHARETLLAAIEPNKPDIYDSYLKVLAAIALQRLNRKEEAVKELEQICVPSTDQEIFIITNLLKLIHLTEADRRYLPELEKFVRTLPEKLARSPEFNCILALAYQTIGGLDERRKIHNLLKDSSIAIQRMRLSELPHHLRLNYIELILNSKYWNSDKLAFDNSEELKLIKDNYVAYFKATRNYNIAIQALCTDTLLGCLFSTSRDEVFVATYISGRLRDMLLALEEKPHELPGIDQLSNETQIALLNHVTKYSSNFICDLAQSYPETAKWLNGLLTLIKDKQNQPTHFALTPLDSATINKDVYRSVNNNSL